MAEHRLLSLDDIAQMAAEGHSAFSPSASKMWLTCSGSLIPNLLAEDDTSVEAAEGTVAHAVAEEWLRTGKRPKHLIGQTKTADGWDILITEEMMAYVGDYVAWCSALEEDAAEFRVETRVDFSDLTPIPNQGGTSDCIALVPLDSDPTWKRGKKGRPYKLIVRDLKYGKGVRVLAQGNTQGLLYAYGAWKIFKDRYNIVEIEIGICHPRLDEGTTTWTVTPEALLEFADLAKARAKAAWRFDAERTPSDEGCQWCKVRATCPAAYKHLSEVTSDVFDDDEDDDLLTDEEGRCVICEGGGCDACRDRKSYDADEMAAINEDLEDDFGDEPFKPANPSQLSTKALAKVLRYRSMMEKFFNSVEAELLDRSISREEEIPGWKLVEGRANRKWPDNEAHVYLKLRRLGLKDGAIYKTEMLSPAQIEAKLHAKAGLTRAQAGKVVNAMAIKPPGKKSLVRASDKRPALPSDGSVFDDDEDE